MTSNADKLKLGADDVIWVIGDSVEEKALLDPLPEGAETVDEPIDRMNAAILLADSAKGLHDRLDEVLPALGSTPVAWISYPTVGSAQIDRDTVARLVEVYGWGVGPEVRLDETWVAVRLRQV